MTDKSPPTTPPAKKATPKTKSTTPPSTTPPKTGGASKTGKATPTTTPKPKKVPSKTGPATAPSAVSADSKFEGLDPDNTRAFAGVLAKFVAEISPLSKELLTIGADPKYQPLAKASADAVTSWSYEVNRLADTLRRKADQMGGATATTTQSGAKPATTTKEKLPSDDALARDLTKSLEDKDPVAATVAIKKYSAGHSPSETEKFIKDGFRGHEDQLDEVASQGLGFEGTSTVPRWDVQTSTAFAKAVFSMDGKSNEKAAVFAVYCESRQGAAVFADDRKLLDQAIGLDDNVKGGVGASVEKLYNNAPNDDQKLSVTKALLTKDGEMSDSLKKAAVSIVNSPLVVKTFGEEGQKKFDAKETMAILEFIDVTSLKRLSSKRLAELTGEILNFGGSEVTWKDFLKLKKVFDAVDADHNERVRFLEAVGIANLRKYLTSLFYLGSESRNAKFVDSIKLSFGDIFNDASNDSKYSEIDPDGIRTLKSGSLLQQLIATTLPEGLSYLLKSGSKQTLNEAVLAGISLPLLQLYSVYNGGRGGDNEIIASFYGLVVDELSADAKRHAKDVFGSSAIDILLLSKSETYGDIATRMVRLFQKYPPDLAAAAGSLAQNSLNKGFNGSLPQDLSAASRDRVAALLASLEGGLKEISAPGKVALSQAFGNLLLDTKYGPILKATFGDLPGREGEINPFRLTKMLRTLETIGDTEESEQTLMVAVGMYLVQQPDGWARNSDNASAITDVVAGVMKSIVVGEALTANREKEKRQALMDFLGVAISAASEFAPGFGAPIGYVYGKITDAVVGSVKRKGISAYTNDEIKASLHHLFLTSVTDLKTVAGKIPQYAKYGPNGEVKLAPPAMGEKDPATGKLISTPKELADAEEAFWSAYNNSLPEDLVRERADFTNAVSHAILGEEVDLLTGKKG
jgi:hypothetical protein